MTTIGTAVLQIIPSLDGVSKSIDKQLDGTFRVAGQRGGKQLAKGVGDGLKDLERDVESTGRAYQKLKDKASDALGKVRADEAALTKLRSSGASDDRIIRAEERLAKSRRDSGRASRDAEDGHRSLAAAQSALASSSGNLGSNLTGLAAVASRVGPALATVGAAAAGAAVAGIALLAAGAVKATSELYQLGASFDDTFDSLRIKTGATGPQLQALEEATKRISTGVPLAIGDIGAVVGETSRALHLTGTDLDNVSKNIANLGRLTGESVDVRTLGKAFRGFGVDAKDQVPALDSLFRASQSTGVGVNELLATVVKGGAGLRQFGFDFGQSAALATQFEESGLDADKAMAGLTKGLASLAKDGQTGQQALKDNVTQIKNLIATGDEAGALDLTNKLFGARGGVQFFEAIRNGALDLDTLSSALSGTGDTIQAAAADTDDFAEKWQEFKNQAAVALEPLATGLFDSINTELTGLTTWISAHQGEIIGFFEGLGSIVITAAEHVAHGAGGMLQAIGDLVGGLGNVKGVLDNTMAFFADLRGDHAAADEFRRSAQEAFGWGEAIRAAGDRLVGLNLDPARNKLSGWADAARDAAGQARNAAGELAGLGTALGALPPRKDVDVHLTTAEATTKLNQFFDMFRNPPPVNVNVKPGSDALAPSFFTPPTPGRASGGPISGPGGPKSDIIPIWASNGEHMLSAKDVQAMGGQSGVYAFRGMLHRAGGGGIWSMAQIPWLPDKVRKTRDAPGNVPNLDPGSNPAQGALPSWWDPEAPIPNGIPGLPKPPTRDDILFPDWMPPGQRDEWLRRWGDNARKIKLLGFAGGGAIGPDVQVAGELVGTDYSQARRTDCSGMVARVIDRTLGMPETGLMSTKNAADWLAARGFKKGIGGPGTISVGWYDHGPNPNDGHMAMTLSDGSNAEAGGGVGDIFQIGGGAAGASDPQFDQHMYLPTVYGEGAAGSSSASSPFAGGSAIAAVTGGAPADVSSSGGGGTSSSSGGGVSISLPSAFSGLAGIGLDGLGIKTKVSDDTPERTLELGKAAAAAVGGQVSSALDVFGVGDSPGWLKGISQLIGGISIGGGGGSADPLSATSSGTGTPPPDDPGNMHGGRAGQAPGPQVVINARDTEDAFIRYQRYQNEKSAAKLNRF